MALHGYHYHSHLMDDFLFQEVLGDEQEGVEAARLLLETIMGRKIGEITVVTQKTSTTGSTGQHGIRMDVYLKEDGGVIYDLEAQKADTGELPQRTRYYQALMDGRLLKSGNGYKNLPPVVIILIMQEDIFQHDRMFYTFENRCVELPELSLEDGAKRIFLYIRGGRGGSKELSDLLHYIENSQKENAVSPVTRRLHQIVTRVKNNEEVGVRYMKAWEYEMMIKENAIKEGIEKGRTQELVCLVMKKLKKGLEAEQIADILEEDTEKISEIIELLTEAEEKEEDISYVVQQLCKKY